LHFEVLPTTRIRLTMAATNGTTKVNVLRSTDTVLDGPSELNNVAHPYFPTYKSLSKSTWELWIFDAVDAEANCAVTMSFFLEGPQILMKNLPLRATFQASMPNGSNIRAEDFARETISEIDEAAGVVRTKMLSDKFSEDNCSVTSEVALDLSHATVTFDIPAVKGTLKLKSTGQKRSSVPHSGTGTGEEKQVEMAPTCYYVHSFPRAIAEADFTFPEAENGEGEEKGRSIKFEGYGGSDHTFMTAPTQVIMDECSYIHGHVGPYSVNLMRIGSRPAGGEFKIKVTIVHDNDGVVFECISDDSPSLTDDSVVLRLSQGGNVRGNFSDTSTGYKLDCLSPKNGKHWKFDIAHNKLWWSMPTAPPPAKTGNNGFVSLIKGGEVEGEQYSGSATTGHVQLPFKKSEYAGFNNRDHTK
jgi:hypothetical protein